MKSNQFMVYAGAVAVFLTSAQNIATHCVGRTQNFFNVERDGT
jgi:hypothetical protein